MTPAPARRRAKNALRRQKQAAQHQDGPLQLALTQLDDAITALTAPQPHPGPAGTVWLDSRYTQLRDAIATASVSGHHKTTPSSLIPAQIDCLKLAIQIDIRTTEITHPFGLVGDTSQRLHALLKSRWRPQDSKLLTEMSSEIQSWTKAVDDLFSPKPVYLPDPCPHCRQQFTYRLSDCGERVRTRALSITAHNGAVCGSCHDTWPPSELLFLGRLLGYHTEGIA